MKNWEIAFWTPGNMPSEDGDTFGCASHGFCTNDSWINPEESAVASWEHTLCGVVLKGTYSEVILGLEQLDFVPRVAIALFAKSFGMEDFLVSFNNCLPEVAIVGGGAALGVGQSQGELLPKAEEVVLLLTEELEFKTETFNVHQPTDDIIEIVPVSNRSFKLARRQGCVEWEDAVRLFASLQLKYKKQEVDFESITLSDISGRNIHCSEAEIGIKCGANLPDDCQFVVKTTSRESALEQIDMFFKSENALVFGCAGLRSLLDTKVSTGKGTLAGFMFGELVTLKELPKFGNLMLSKLVKGK